MTPIKRRGNFLGWPCLRVSWRWNAVVHLQGFLLLRSRAVRQAAALGTLPASHAPANDTRSWWQT